MGHAARHLTLGILAVACSLGLGPTAWAAEATAVAVAADDVRIQATLGQQPLLVYRFAEVPKKPYVEQLYSPRGVNVLRDSPVDHKHHHALMFAVGVNGTNFWAENDGSGRQENRSIGGASVKAGDAGPQARIVQKLDWVAPQGTPLLVEQRTILAGRSKDGSATLLTWRSRLEPPAGNKAVLGGSHYFGLGIRFLASMDQEGRFFNAENKEGEPVRGTERLTAVRWMAYTASADGKPVTVALFDHPANPRHPARMFSMTRPFAYLSATLNLWKEPLEIPAGQTLELSYGVAVWDGRVGAPEVEALYRQWVAADSQ